MSFVGGFFRLGALAGAFLLCAAGVQAAELSKVSALAVTETSQLVEWDTDVPATSVVSYRLEGKGSWKKVSVGKLAFHHELVLKKLKAGKKYSFKISGKDGLKKSLKARQFSFVAGQDGPDSRTVSAELISLPVRTSSFADKIGVVQWDPTHARWGADTLAAMGAKNFSTVVSANCAIPGETLTRVAQKPDMHAALSNPSLKVYRLVSFDSAICPSRIYVDPAFYTRTNALRVENEYANFALYLAQRFNGTGKKFFISNWETERAGSGSTAITTISPRSDSCSRKSTGRSFRDLRSSGREARSR